MNREQKAVAIAEIAARIDESSAVFAVDYRGISVSQAAELRARLRDADATFTVVKNSLTERAADQVGTETLKEFLTGPTALTFVHGDAATAAKAIADFARATQLLALKGGLMDGCVLDVEQIRAISRLPSREALYGQLVGVVASPVTGLVRTLNALVGGLAVALGQVREKKESGEIPAAAPPAAEVPVQGTPAEAETSGEAAPEQTTEEAAAGQSPEASGGEPTTGADEAATPAADGAAGQATVKPSAEDPSPSEASPADEPPPEEALAEDTADAPPAEEAKAEEPTAETSTKAAPEVPPAEEPPPEQPPPEEALAEDAADAPPADEGEAARGEEANQADASAQGGAEAAEKNPTKED